jgi:hypothetical protein
MLCNVSHRLDVFHMLCTRCGHILSFLQFNEDAVQEVVPKRDVPKLKDAYMESHHAPELSRALASSRSTVRELPGCVC